MNLRSFLRSGWAALGGLGWCLATAGCISPRPPPAAIPPVVARLLVENLTDYEWHIAVAAAIGPETREARVAARSSIEVTLAGGDYVIEQTVVTGIAGGGLARRLPARLEPGQTYRWRLGTLLSDPAGNAGRDPR